MKYYLKTIPDRAKSTFTRAFSGKSKASALKAKCLDCSNFQMEEIKLCPVKKCPLWQYRPYQVKVESSSS